MLPNDTMPSISKAEDLVNMFKEIYLNYSPNAVKGWLKLQIQEQLCSTVCTCPGKAVLGAD